MNETSATVPEFNPFIVRTENIAKVLVTTANTYGMKVSDFDFNLLEVQTFILKEGEAEEEINKDKLNTLNDKTLLSDPKLGIRQTYEIEIIRSSKDSPFYTFFLSIGANSSMSRLFASIKAGSVIEYYDDIEKDLKRFIDKRKLRANMLINFWEGGSAEEISRFVAKIKVAHTLKVEEKISFEIGVCLEPIPTVNDKFIVYYEGKKEEDKMKKVDHSKRGFVRGVVKGQVLFEYIKPRKGEAGRNCRGEYIEEAEPLVTAVPAFNLSDKIEVKETDKSIQYKAKISGYIVYENNTYDIQVELEVTEISFKTTGSIEAGRDADVSINVKEADPFKDAIGEGMEIEVNEINVDGNVGNNAIIRAHKACVLGQTHQSSYIEADDIEINIHKGRAKGITVKITRLEQGIIEADRVEITQALGGKIIAKEVIIETISSHVEVIASDKIEIKNFKGEENSFTITPVLNEEDKETLTDKDANLLKQERKIRKLQEEVASKQQVLDDNEDSIEDLKERLEHYKESGTKMPGSFVVKFKEFKDLQKHVVSLNKELQENIDMLELLSAGTKRLQKDILKSKIINHDTYKGHNEIRFKVLQPEEELYYVPQGDSQEVYFMLKYDEENESYQIEGKDTIT
ncbi:MAG TPA: DUF342 domain-containing protein [Sulfurimonas sp.]|nr:DUF342 domain-containing protein [Sulfurimonas sp.]